MFRLRNKHVDTRIYQIAVLGTLIIYAVVYLNLPILPWVAITIPLAALSTQFLCSRLVHISFEWRSALITACSLTLLLRTDTVWLAALAAAIAISSKFLLRLDDKHLFNPANLALVVITLGFDDAWISTGQWGQLAWFALLIAGAGWFVTTRSSRLDITLAFFMSYGTCLLIRALWLGDPLTIPLHQLQNGALLIFAFFMISDPVSTPNTRSGRIVFALLVATAGFILQFGFYQPQGVIYALIISGLITPLLNKILPGGPFRWKAVSPPERTDTDTYPTQLTGSRL